VREEFHDVEEIAGVLAIHGSHQLSAITERSPRFTSSFVSPISAAARACTWNSRLASRSRATRNASLIAVKASVRGIR
jgi:hypothetical protein